MSNSFNIGPVNISYYAICILLGALVAYLMTRKEWAKKGYAMNLLNDFYINCLIIGIIGARIWYVLFHLPFYLANPGQIIAIRQGGLAIQGGLILGIIYAYFYFKKHKIDFWDASDTILPYILIAQAIGRWGNFFNQEAYGNVVTHEQLRNQLIPNFIIDHMFINGQYRQPTFLYESIWCIIAFIIIRLIIKFIKLKVGHSALLYIILYSLGRVFIEGLRADSLMFFGLKTAQIVSVIAILGSVYLFVRFYKTHQENKLQLLKGK